MTEAEQISETVKKAIDMAVRSLPPSRDVHLTFVNACIDQLNKELTWGRDEKRILEIYKLRLAYAAAALVFVSRKNDTKVKGGDD